MSSSNEDGEQQQQQQPSRRPNLTDSILVTRLRSSSVPPPVPPHFPPSQASTSSPSRPQQPPFPAGQRVRPPNLTLPHQVLCPQVEDEQTPGELPSVSSPSSFSSLKPSPLHVPHTPATHCAPWHGRSSSDIAESSACNGRSTPSLHQAISLHGKTREAQRTLNEQVVPTLKPSPPTSPPLTRRHTCPDLTAEWSVETTRRSDEGSLSVEGVFSLEAAVLHGDSHLVETFLKRGFHPDGEPNSKSCPLTLASAFGRDRLVRLLLAAGADVNRRDIENSTPLHHAAASGHRGVLKLLLVAGADMFARNYENLLPIELASDNRVLALLTSRMRSDATSSLSSSEDWLESPSRATMMEVTGNVGHQADLKTQSSAPDHFPEFTPPSAEDLSLIRQEWHDAARSGCVGCGKEDCFGRCLPEQKATSRTPEPERNAGALRWTRGELLGEGAYGKVFAGLNQTTGELMAVKQLNIEPAEGHDPKLNFTSLEKEIDLYKSLRHKHIVGYIGMEKDETHSYLYIFLEYVSGGSIQSMLERFGRFSEPLVRVYTRQLLLGLQYLHSNKIVHRDIKGGNVLVDGDGVVKLADFGASKDPSITDACKSIRGSVFWMAPEVIKGDGYGRRADIWSVGCTVIEMFTAMHPWPGIDNTWTAIFHIAKASSGPPIPEDLSACSKDFLQQCFQLDVSSRPTASQLLQHPFVAIDDQSQT